MRKFCFTLLLLVVGFSALSQVDQPDIKGIVSFSIKNFGLSTKGTFEGMTGIVDFNPNDLNTSKFDVSIKANSINTNNKARDKHLRSEDYFEVETYPKINFKSNTFQASAGNFKVEGVLTIKNKSLPVTIPFTYEEKDGNGSFEGSLTINRLDYTVGKSSWTLADEVKIKIKAVVN